MTFGRMPIANAFLTADEFADEYFFELAPAFCESCGTFQITEQPDAEQMFHGAYPFFTRSSRRMVAHFADYANWLRDTYLPADPFVVEIGSNDGAMLENFARAGKRHLGVEPSSNTADVAREHGVESLVAFFGAETAVRVRDTHGPADAIIAANVMCHIPDLHGIAEGAAKLLTEDGVLVFEEPYLGAMVEKTSYDQIYDEHVFIFSLQAVSSLFAPHGLELIEALPQDTHGGSMRYVLARKGRRPVTPSVGNLLAREHELGLHLASTYDRFRDNCETSRRELRALLDRLHTEGKRVAGYAATSKSTTVINYCGLTPEHIAYISDTTPLKQGKFSPGGHIPVVPHETFAADYPEYAVLFAWNHRDEILANEQAFARAGNKWISFVPEVTIEDGTNA